MGIRRQRLGEILWDRELISEQQIQDALTLQERNEELRFGEALIKLGAIDAAQVASALAQQFGLPLEEKVDDEEVDLGLIRQIPISFCKTHGVLPMQRGPGGVVEVVISDPVNLSAADDLRVLLDAPIEITLGPADQVEEAINRAYDRATRSAAEMADELEEQHEGEEAGGLDSVDLLEQAGEDDAPIIRFVNSLFTEALNERASDIHIEPFERELQVRFRIDGVLYSKVSPPKKAQAAITSRLKIMSNLDIAEKRLPQDGRIRLKAAGRDVDIRVSTVPVAHGERIVMRLQNRSAGLLGLDHVGMEGQALHGFRELVHRPHGIVLVTGPTGSGKTTTLYAAISEINQAGINILTVEDPIEFQIQGIGQMAVNSKINLTFASGLRAYLRQDPDVILVGETRDRETAEIAIQASLTGHLVLSTLHTNDAASAVNRLVDMGVEPFMVGSSLVGVLAQRLVRRVCPDCRQAYVPTDEELGNLGIERSAIGGPVYRAHGTDCATCLGTGYKGRTGIYELLLVNDTIRSLITRNVPSGHIKKAAVEGGMTTLRDDGAKKFLQGLTTVEEVMRITAEDTAGALEALA